MTPPANGNYWVWDGKAKDWTVWEVFHGCVVVGGIKTSAEYQHNTFGWEFFGPIPDPEFVMSCRQRAFTEHALYYSIVFPTTPPNPPQDEPQPEHSTKELAEKIEALEAKVARLCNVLTERALRGELRDGVFR